MIDTDPGVDDAHAIMLAVAHASHGATVEALTVVAGNVGLDRATANACTILDVLEIPPERTPVFAGCGCALLGGTQRAIVHGQDGLGDSRFPPSARPVEKEHAALALVRLANERPGELTLAAIGPLTNVALATRLDAALPQKYKRLVVMGGAIHGAGNMPNPSTEFNISADPEAAAIVFDTWPGLSLVSWETTVRHALSAGQVDELLQAGTPRARFLGRITGVMLAYLREELGRPGLFTPDPLALAVALEPDIVTRAERHAVTVELTGTHTRGQTTVDWSGASGRAPSVDVILEIDVERFWAMLKAAVA